MNKIWVFVFITFLLAGCASLLQTEQLQSVIRKPVNYCKLNQAYHKVATLEDAPLYDDSKCYTDGFHQLNIERKIEKNKYEGTFTRVSGYRYDIYAYLPDSVKLGGSREQLPDDLCILAGKDDEFGSQNPYISEDSKRAPSGGWYKVIKIVRKPKLTIEQRKNKLPEIQNKIDEEYSKKQRKYDYEYEECNKNHQTITEFWQQGVGIKKFCQSIEYSWFTRHCLASKEDTEECKTLKDLFIDCYRQGAMKVDDTYVRLTFFN